MTSEVLIFLNSRLKAGMPPSNLSLVREVASLDWTSVIGNNIDIACEIILRISADVIVCASDMNGEDRLEYESAFYDLKSNIDRSGLIGSSSEFDAYYNKYIEYLSDFDFN
jgi:hypothetical protein